MTAAVNNSLTLYGTLFQAGMLSEKYLCKQILVIDV